METFDRYILHKQLLKKIGKFSRHMLTKVVRETEIVIKTYRQAVTEKETYTTKEREILIVKE